MKIHTHTYIDIYILLPRFVWCGPFLRQAWLIRDSFSCHSWLIRGSFIFCFVCQWWLIHDSFVIPSYVILDSFVALSFFLFNVNGDSFMTRSWLLLTSFMTRSWLIRDFLNVICDSFVIPCYVIRESCVLLCAIFVNHGWLIRESFHVIRDSFVIACYAILESCLLLCIKFQYLWIMVDSFVTPFMSFVTHSWLLVIIVLLYRFDIRESWLTYSWLCCLSFVTRL